MKNLLVLFLTFLMLITTAACANETPDTNLSTDGNNQLVNEEIIGSEDISKETTIEEVKPKLIFEDIDIDVVDTKELSELTFPSGVYVMTLTDSIESSEDYSVTNKDEIKYGSVEFIQNTNDSAVIPVNLLKKMELPHGVVRKIFVVSEDTESAKLLVKTDGHNWNIKINTFNDKELDSCTTNIQGSGSVTTGKFKGSNKVEKFTLTVEVPEPITQLINFDLDLYKATSSNTATGLLYSIRFDSTDGIVWQGKLEIDLNEYNDYFFNINTEYSWNIRCGDDPLTIYKNGIKQNKG